MHIAFMQPALMDCARNYRTLWGSDTTAKGEFRFAALAFVENAWLLDARRSSARGREVVGQRGAAA